MSRIRAEGLFFLRAMRSLARPFTMLIVVATIGAVVQRNFGQAADQPMPAWDQSFFVAYTLLFFEHIEPIPVHPIGQVVHYLWPLLGIVLLTEGIIKLGMTVFKKESDARGWITLMATASRGHVILCGLGTVGYRVLSELQDMELTVFAIERDEHAQFLSNARETGCHVLVGDPRTPGVLESLNIAKARAVIIATDDDLANLEIAMDVREARADVPIVMRMFDQNLAQKVRTTLGIEVSVSTSKLAAPLLASAALDPSVVGTHTVGNSKLVVMQIPVLAGFVGVKVQTIALEHDGTVVAVRPVGGKWSLQPSPKQALVAGEEIQVMVQSHVIDRIHAANRG